MFCISGPCVIQENVRVVITAFISQEAHYFRQKELAGTRLAKMPTINNNFYTLLRSGEKVTNSLPLQVGTHLEEQ